jgi:hypothetical protein
VPKFVSCGPFRPGTDLALSAPKLMPLVITYTGYHDVSGDVSSDVSSDV